MKLTDLSTVNAVLNATSAFFLVGGYWAVRTHRWILHRKFMLAAITTSALFLVTYLTYHYLHGSTKYMGEHRELYFTILISHTILAVAVLPLVLVTSARALKAHKADPQFLSTDALVRFSRHRKIARITFPIWLYVSVTGVIVYWMLYRM